MLESSPADVGGYKSISTALMGQDVYNTLKFESGVHRVQRVPATETQGRVHTSTASVVVMPEATEMDVQIREADLRIDTYRSQGAGGQHVNTTDSAVRITHLPTGIVVTCSDERSQHKNREKATRVLRARIYQEQQRKKEEALRRERKSAIGTGDRNERIRTYNFSQDRVTDHRVNLTLYGVEDVLAGHQLGDFIHALQQQRQIQLFEELMMLSEAEG